MTDTSPSSERSVLRAIAGDIHFWIPLLVLIAGIALLHELH